MTRPRLRRHELPEDVAAVLAEVPLSVLRKAARYLVDHRNHRGRERAITIVIALDDEDGRPTPHGSYVQPPREWAEEERTA